MRYPMFSNWVKIWNDGEAYRLKNILTDEEFGCSEFGDDAFIDFICRLDGKTDPYQIPCPYSREVVAGILEQLKAFSLLRTDRWVIKSLTGLTYSLIIPKRKASGHILSKILNVLLVLLVFPSLLAVVMDLPPVLDAVYTVSIPGMILGVLLGGILHEAGHAVAAWASGGMVFEFGVMMTHLIMPGAYTLIERNENAGFYQNLQIDAAGIEVNALLAGLFFHTARIFPGLSDFFFMMGIMNLIFFLLNLTGVIRSDGSHILGGLLGVEGEIGNEARETLFDRARFDYWMEKGPAGKARLGAYALILLMQAAIPAMIIVEVLGVFIWFA